MKYIRSLILTLTIIFLPSINYPQVSNSEKRFEDIQKILNQAKIKYLHSFYYESTKHQRKCGLASSFDIINHWNSFTNKQKEELRILLSPPQTQKDTIIGRFHIFYDSTGYNEPALLDSNFQRVQNTAEAYVDSVGKILNYVWSYQIDTLGYLPPPFEFGQLYYNIFVRDLGPSLYGQTIFVDQIGSYIPQRYTSYIEVDNDFNLHYSRGMAGLKVTAAHEFHHAIQIGQYGFRYEDLYFYEVTSTWMEDVVYNDVNDYYQYLKMITGVPRGHFASPNAAFTYTGSNIEYSRAIWGKFIEKRFSHVVMRQSCEFIRAGQTSLNAIDHALTNVGSSFRNAFLEWTIWNYNTGPTSDTLKYYTEGRQYPTIRERAITQYTHPHFLLQDSVEAISCAYHPIKVNGDSMLVIVSNINMEQAYSRQRLTFEYELSDTGNATFKHLTNGVYIRLNVSDPANWNSWESKDIVVQSVDNYEPPSSFILEQNYPNPFNPKTTIQFKISFTTFVELKVHNLVGQEIITLVSQEKNKGEHRIVWDASGIPSGVYFCRLKAGSLVDTKKIILLR